jgi:hypothetical protein
MEEAMQAILKKVDVLWEVGSAVAGYDERLSKTLPLTPAFI